LALQSDYSMAILAALMCTVILFQKKGKFRVKSGGFNVFSQSEYYSPVVWL